MTARSSNALEGAGASLSESEPLSRQALRVIEGNNKAAQYLATCKRSKPTPTSWR